MKVGLLYFLRNPPQPRWFKPWPRFYGQALDHMQEMDRLGFASINFTEHHFDPDGYNPSVVVMMTAAAQRTRRATLGQNILQLPYHHPVRLAEDLATVDILSGGRVTLSVGQAGGGRAGTAFDSEFRAFGINAKERPSRTEEGLEIIRKCWTEEVFSYQGKRWQLEDVRVYPKPLQKPHPPIYLAAGSEAAMDRAARLGLNACAQGGGSFDFLGDRAQWQAWRERWRAALAKYSRRPEDVQCNTWGACFVTDDPEREWARHREAIFYTVTYRRHDGLQPYANIVAPGVMLEKPEDLPNWQHIFRTPEDCLKHLRETFSESAPDDLYLVADKPGIPWEDTLEYHRNFAEKVLPHLNDLP